MSRRTVSFAGLTTVLVASTALAGPTYHAVLLDDGGYHNVAARAIANGRPAGVNNFNGGSLGIPLVWPDLAGRPVDLTPPGYVTSSVFGADGSAIAGSSIHLASLQRHAILWTAADASAIVDLQPAGATESFLWGAGGGQQVGIVQAPGFGQHAFVWSRSAGSAVDLNPPGFRFSMAWATDGVQQVGWAMGTYAPYVDEHAILWSGTPGSFVDLTPLGHGESHALGVAGGQQVGYGMFGAHRDDRHAVLWHGTAESYVDLHPASNGSSIAFATNGTYQVGQVNGTAALWAGSADTYVNLADYLPANVRDWESGALAIDAQGNVAGYYSDPTGYHAVVWLVPEPGLGVIWGIAASSYLFRKRPRT